MKGSGHRDFLNSASKPHGMIVPKNILPSTGISSSLFMACAKLLFDA
jgi:hypothetical protein